MRSIDCFSVSLSLAMSLFVVRANALTCSTEKANPSCTITIDRYYPITLPTIQMRPGATVTVEIARPLDFETPSLDLQSTQAVATTDATQAIGTAVLGQAKGFVAAARVSLKQQLDLGNINIPQDIVPQIRHLRDIMTQKGEDAKQFLDKCTEVYTELQEIVGNIPPDALMKQHRVDTQPLFNTSTPEPWKDYSTWRNWMLCELGNTCSYNPGPKPQFRNLLGEAVPIASSLATCPSGKEDNPDSPVIDCRIKYLKNQRSDVPDDQKTAFDKAMSSLDEAYATLVADNTALANVTKDLGSYYVNIESWQGPVIKSPSSIRTVERFEKDGTTTKIQFRTLGSISDPAKQGLNGSLAAKLLGRQVVYSVNTVNQISTFVASVPTTAQKKAIATVTILYADPIVEPSAGAFFSTLPNRSFANQTIVTQNPGTVPNPGNVVIAQTTSRPTIIPFAAANWRLGHDFLIGGRRSAFYLTAAIGINTYNTTAEFGVGPSLSWRGLVVSALYHEGHDVRLTQGQQLGQVWCNMTAANGAIPKCSGSPPNPTTERYWTGAFAIGVGVRVPAVFSSGPH